MGRLRFIVLVQSLAAGMCRSAHPCKGVWTREWQEAEGGLPLNLPIDLNRSGLASLKARLSRHECPFGTSLVGQVTWPDPPSDLLDVVARRSFVQVAAVIFSYIPYAVALWVVVIFCVVRGTRQLFVLLYLALFVVLNEFIIKELFHIPRPGARLDWSVDGKLVGSCLCSCGMPSSHSGLSIGLMLLIFLDASQRVGFPYLLGWRKRIKVMRQLASARGQRDGRKGLVKGEAQEWIIFTVRCWALPWTQANSFSHDEYVAYVLFWVVLLGPVPFSRLLLYDHSVQQVLAGMTEGLALAVLWWRFVRNVQKVYRFPNGMTFLGGWLVHNFEAEVVEPECTESNEVTDSSDEECGSASDQNSETVSE